MHTWEANTSLKYSNTFLEVFNVLLYDTNATGFNAAYQRGRPKLLQS